MNDWLLESGILVFLIKGFISGTLLVLLTILVRKAVLKIQTILNKRIEQNYLGYLTNAIDSKVHGLDEDYNIHVQKLRSATQKSIVRKGVLEVFSSLETSISGDYKEATLALKSDINLSPKKKPNSRQGSKGFNFRFKRIKSLFYNNKSNTDELLEALDFKEKIALYGRAFNELVRIKIFNVLSEYPKDKFPDLTPALQIHKAEILLFLAEVIGRLKREEYVLPLIHSVIQTSGESDEIVNECLCHFTSRKDLRKLQTLLISTDDFESKRYLLDHFKKVCLT